jgi:fructokinase
MKPVQKQPLVVGVGELVWDLLPSGKKLGGAPANFAHHANQLGARSAVVSSVGDDPAGIEIFRQLGILGISVETVSIHPSLPTSTVTVKLDAQGIPSYAIHENVAWDDLVVNLASARAVAAADAIVFGSLAQRSTRSSEAIFSLLKSAPAGALRVFDINLRQPHFTRGIIEQGLQVADVLKLNDVELGFLETWLGLRGNERQQLEQLIKSYELKWVALTRGARGSLLCSEDEVSDDPGVPTTIVDTVGAGDAYTACLTLGLLHGWSLDLINRRANELAAFVCSCAGATPVLPGAMRGWFACSRLEVPPPARFPEPQVALPGQSVSNH